jgi:hypothetical protein
MNAGANGLDGEKGEIGSEPRSHTPRKTVEKQTNANQPLALAA